MANNMKKLTTNLINTSSPLVIPDFFPFPEEGLEILLGDKKLLIRINDQDSQLSILIKIKVWIEWVICG